MVKYKCSIMENDEEEGEGRGGWVRSRKGWVGGGGKLGYYCFCFGLFYFYSIIFK